MEEIDNETPSKSEFRIGINGYIINEINVNAYFFIKHSDKRMNS